MAIFEMMRDELRDSRTRLRAGVRSAKIREAAIRGGMRSLLGDGKIKILRGVTTPVESRTFRSDRRLRSVGDRRRLIRSTSRP